MDCLERVQKNGVLTVRMPSKAWAKANVKQIEVKAG
jgi:HSP20 family molecular chaperone IbpA